MKSWKHDELLNDLVDHLSRPERMLWKDMQLGPSGSPRPDVYTLNKSYSKPRPLAYEIKVSVADFRSDVTVGKWQQYLDFAQGVIFCVPKGLVTKADVPPACGLMVRSDNCWRTIKGPTLNPVTIDFHAMLKLLIDGIDRKHEANRVREINKWLLNDRIKKELGSEVAKVLTDRDAIINDAKWESKRLIDRAEMDVLAKKSTIESLQKQIDDFEAVRKRTLGKLAATLGITIGEFNWEWRVIAAAKEFKLKHDADERLASARDCISNITRSVEGALKHLDNITNEQA